MKFAFLLAVWGSAAYANPGDTFTSAALKTYQCATSGVTTVGNETSVENTTATIKAADGASAVAAYYAANSIHNWLSDSPLSIDTSALSVTCVEQ